MVALLPEIDTCEDRAKTFSLRPESIQNELSTEKKKPTEQASEQAVVIFLSRYRDFCATSDSAICYCPKPRNEDSGSQGLCSKQRSCWGLCSLPFAKWDRTLAAIL